MNPSRTLPPAVVTTLVTVLLALQWWLGVSATRQINTTADEIAHVAGGFSYWKFTDYRLQPENGNLPQRLAALPWVAANAHFDTTDAKSWGNSNVWILSHRFFYESGNNTDYLLLLSRSLLALMGVALGWLIFAWSRSFWGDAGGLVSLGLYVFCPSFLAHSPLVTSDVTMAFFLLLTTAAFWRQSHVLSWGTWAGSAFALGFACVAKFSCVLLGPILGLLIVVRMLSGQPLELNLGRNPRALRGWPKLTALLLSSFGQIAVAWLVIWAFFGFRFSAFSSHLPKAEQFFWAWEIVLPSAGFMRTVLETGREWRILPEAYLQGFAFVLHGSAERGAFLNGEYSGTGWIHFFPYAFLVKTPFSQLIAFALAGIVIVRELWGHRRARSLRAWAGKWGYRFSPLLALFTVYWIFSLLSHLNIGHRHILPIYPPLFILAGLLARPAATRALRLAGAALVVGVLVESMLIRPHYLAYFNRIAGGPAQGYRHLIDSSLDWGQDLPELSAWLRRSAQPGEPVYVSYFGSGDTKYEGIQARELAPIYNFDKPRQWFELGPGLYCIGATMLQDVYSGWRGPWTLEKERSYLALRGQVANAPVARTPEELRKRSERLYALDRLRFARLCQYLRLREPDASIGYSILVYRLNADEIKAVVDGSMSDLAAAIARAMKARGL